MKIGFFITARLKSTRLKRKILLDLNGKTVLDRVIERCKAVDTDGVVLCTSTNPQDSELYDYAQKNKIQFYAGSEDDVLQRLLDAATYYSYDAFLSITADNPLHSIYIAKFLTKLQRDKSFDFIFTSGLPIGITPYVLETKALAVACHMKKAADTEIWGPFVNQPSFFNIAKVKIRNSDFDENKRITCDYPEDYNLFSELFKNFPEDYNPSIFEIFEILKNNPHLWKLNNRIVQRFPSEKVIKKIEKQFEEQRNSGIAYAASIQKIIKPLEEFISIDI